MNHHLKPCRLRPTCTTAECLFFKLRANQMQHHQDSWADLAVPIHLDHANVHHQHTNSLEEAVLLQNWNLEEEPSWSSQIHGWDRVDWTCSCCSFGRDQTPHSCWSEKQVMEKDRVGWGGTYAHLNLGPVSGSWEQKPHFTPKWVTCGVLGERKA